MYLLAVAGLCCLRGLFSSCDARASRGFSCCRAPALRAHRLQQLRPWASCSAACGIFPRPGTRIKALCVARWTLTIEPPGKLCYRIFFKGEPFVLA